jgi:hypothetical protein
MQCDAGDYVSGVIFPTANPRVILPERTFREKAAVLNSTDMSLTVCGG